MILPLEAAVINVKSKPLCAWHCIAQFWSPLSLNVNLGVHNRCIASNTMDSAALCQSQQHAIWVFAGQSTLAMPWRQSSAQRIHFRCLVCARLPLRRLPPASLPQLQWSLSAVKTWQQHRWSPVFLVQPGSKQSQRPAQNVFKHTIHTWHA